MAALSPERREAISKALKGRRLSPAHREHLSRALKGKRKSPEHIAKVSAARRQINPDPQLLHEYYYNRGMTLSEIAGLLGCGLTTVFRCFERYGLQRRASTQSLDIRGTRKGIFTKGCVSPNKGRKSSPEAVEKTRQKLKGKTPWNKGKHFSEYVSPEVRERRKARISETSKSRWADPAYSDRVRRKILASLCAAPNKAEEKLWHLLQTLGLKYEFVGDGSVIIGSLSPDFINTDGKKAIIELFGEPWHSQQEIPRRKAIYWKFGFRTLIVWSKELNDTQALAAKLVAFDRKVAELLNEEILSRKIITLGVDASG